MSSNKLAVSILVIAALFAGYILSVGKNELPTAPKNNVTIENGKQIIEVIAKGGYTPEKSIAKAGMSTVLRMVTDGTFDCSSSVRIPDLGISKGLPQTGTTDIDLGTPKAGVLHGSCGMGMYPFEVDFE